MVNIRVKIVLELRREPEYEVAAGGRYTREKEGCAANPKLYYHAYDQLREL